jgi:Holliday junction DNA helicase RuvA
MIGLLRGRVISRHPPFLLLDVNGVGYEVEAPMSTFYELPAGDEPVTLFTHLAVREDAHILYGFFRERDRALFRSLLKVSGVGGKMALAILSGMTRDEFARSVETGDVAALTRLPGVGKKTAERLIVEMRDRLEAPGLAPVVSPRAAAPLAAGGEAVAALIALGYKPHEASKMIRAVAEPGMETEAMIRKALQGAAK